MSSDRSVLLAACLLVTAACTSRSDDGAPAAAEPPAEVPANAPICGEPVEDRPAQSTCVDRVEGRLVEDATNAPLSLFVSVCGGICFTGRGDEAGFRVPIRRFVDLATFTMHVDGRPDHADVFQRLARPSSEVVVLAGPTLVPRLGERGPVLPDGASSASMVARAGDVTIVLAAGARVAVAITDASRGAEGRTLRSGRVSAAAFVEPRLVTLHALAPFGATVTPRASVAIALPSGSTVADGTALELVALDDDLESAEVGQLRVVGTATVKDHVARSDDGQGIDRLTWVGVRTKEQR